VELPGFETFWKNNTCLLLACSRYFFHTISLVPFKVMQGTQIEGIGLANIGAMILPRGQTPVFILTAAFASSIAAGQEDMKSLPPIRIVFFGNQQISTFNLN